ncbi:MAG: ClbS/DfsB family four-helix bundle protein [Chloroflexi bacterium]|nr:ClbS/DfsB family four-helix bundle protein [Chloroflexota bacterium]
MTQTKAEILENIAQGLAEFEALIGKLSDAQLTARGKDGWRIQDHLAHIAAWEQGIAALLRKQSRYRAMGAGVAEAIRTAKDFDAPNDVIYKLHKDKSLRAVKDYFARTHQDLLAAINALTDADLLKTYSHYQPDEPRDDNGDPILRWIGGNTFGHYAEHSEWIRAMIAEQK